MEISCDGSLRSAYGTSQQGDGCEDPIQRVPPQADSPPFRFQGRLLEAPTSSAHRYEKREVEARYRSKVAGSEEAFRSVRKRAEAIVRYVTARCTYSTIESEIGDQIEAKLRESGITRLTSGREIKAKLLALAFRVVLDFERVAADMATHLLPSSVTSKTGGAKPAPYCRLFGTARAQILESGLYKGAANFIIVLRRKGEGTFNLASHAYDVNRGCLLIYRALKDEYLQHKKSIANWQAETQQHLNLQNKRVPGLVRLLDIATSDGISTGKPENRAVLLDCCNSDLQHIISSHKKLEPGARKSMLLQLLTTIRGLHGQRLSHRDLKPANVLYKTNTEGDKHQTYVADFGVAAPFGEQLRPNGTRHYYPPEALDIRRKDDSATDAYAVGLIAFELKYGSAMRSIAPIIQRFELIYNTFHRGYNQNSFQGGDPFCAAIRSEVGRTRETLSKLPRKEREAALQVQLVSALIKPALKEAIQSLREPLADSADPYDEVVRGLMDPNPLTRWGVSQALDHLSKAE